ncbi:hypothetical protein Ancab_021410 [Ancistrocladus abbreviatus]
MDLNIIETGLVPSSAAAMETYNGDNDQSQQHRQQQQQQQRQQQQQMTIFYDGMVRVCDVTEVQARAIIWLASRAVEERAAISPSLQRQPLFSPVPAAAPPPAVVAASAPAAPPALKRSLQRFLEKRNHRIHAAAPQHH